MVALKDLLRKKLSEKELINLRASFDTVGSIAILEISDELRMQEKFIAQTVLDQNPAIKTVLKKVGKHSGKYRTQKTKFLAGEKTKEATHKENGVLMKLNVEKCYFSPRLSTERMRVAQLVQPNENVLVMFSGIAPYPLVLAKYSIAKTIFGIEKNPIAHKYALENLKLNKISAQKVVLFNADVRKKVPLLKQKFERIIMPLPKTGEEFLDVAFRVIKKNGVIHLYQFAAESSFFLLSEKILDICKLFKKKCKVLGVFKAGQHAPRIYRVRVDIKVLD